VFIICDKNSNLPSHAGNSKLHVAFLLYKDRNTAYLRSVFCTTTVKSV